MGRIKEELEKFAKANGMEKTENVFSINFKEGLFNKTTLDKMINDFVSNVGTTKDEVIKEKFNKENLEKMMDDGRKLLKTMLKEMSPTDEVRKTSEELLKRTEKFAGASSNTDIPQKIFIDWNDMNRAIVSNVAPKIKKKFPKIDTILCITRGGLVPAGILAYALDIKNIINIKVESYDDNNSQKEMKLTALSKKDIKALNKSSGILIVDDILDSGDTIVEVYEYLEYIGGVELVDKTEFFSIVTKDYKSDEFCVYNVTGDDRWVVFPWDV